MAFECKIICDSINNEIHSNNQRRITTIEISYPRFIHSEILTHRDRERNSGSSRAIPWPVMCERISNDPVIPILWGMEKSGMQTGEEIPIKFRSLAIKLWLELRDKAIDTANKLHNIGDTWCDLVPNLQESGDSDIKIHKSICNRLTEPWMWITVVMTATRWNNFFRQRCHPDAEIHFQKIAGMIKTSIENSIPTQLYEGQWHLPYITQNCILEAEQYLKTQLDLLSEFPSNFSLENELLQILKKVSVARCARVSYVQHNEKKKSIEKDVGLWDRLLKGSGLGHFSPFGHAAECMADYNHRSGPFVGWKQFRKQFQNEDMEG